MGCQSTKPMKKQDEREEHVNYKDVEDENPDYPLPYIPDTSKGDIWDSEVNEYIQDRIDNMPAGTDSSYKSLLKYLSEGATKETQRVTAIYLWMKCQDYESDSLDEDDSGPPTHRSERRRPGGKDTRVGPNETPDTPRGYMKMIKDGKGDFTSFFTILCRRSGIPCNVLRGLGKDEQFYIGTPEQHMATKWTAVYVDQDWRLVHIQWAMDHRTDKNKNNAHSQMSDFFFLVDPDIFAHYCQPDDFNWQLLDRPYSKKEFLSLPNFRPASSFLDLTVISPKNSTTKTSKSATELEISFPKKLMEDIEISYVFKFHQELSSTHRDGVTESKSKLPKKLESFVFVNRTRSKFIFEVQIPAAGKYLFDIYAKRVKKSNKQDTPVKEGNKPPTHAFERVVQFRLISELDPEEGDIEPLPDCPENGWGPGPTCRQLGLVPLTHFDSYIFIKPGEFRDIRFRMTRELDVQCQLTHNFLPIYQLVEQIEQEIERDEVHIKVVIPEDGTYALKIYCRPKGTKEYHEACVYLLKQQVQSRFPEKHRDKMLRSRLEYHIENHTKEQDLRDALEMFRCYNVPDHGEVKRGHEKLKHYWDVKRELNCAIRGKNIRNIRKWLERANRSKYKADLKDDIQKAELLEENISKRKGYAHPIARMDEHTITEIHNYKRPPNVVHDVMRSTYLLLGENKEYLDIWEQIQYLMGRTGKQGLKNLILNRRMEDVTPDQADDAEAIIAPYSLDKCRAVSSGIGSFYKWNHVMIQGVYQRDMTERERLEADKQLMGRKTFREDYYEDDTGRNTPAPKGDDHDIAPDTRHSLENRYCPDQVEFYNVKDTDIVDINESDDSKTYSADNDTIFDVRGAHKDESVLVDDDDVYVKSEQGDKVDNYTTLETIEEESNATKTGVIELARYEKHANSNSTQNQETSENKDLPYKRFAQAPSQPKESSRPEPVSYAGFKPHNYNAFNEVSPSKRFKMMPSQPKDTTKSEPVSYAGFKPYDYNNVKDDSPSKRFRELPYQPKDTNKIHPVSYAGFKPYNLS